MRAQIASWIAMSCLSVGAVAESAHAGQLIDNILNRKAQQTGALPPTYPTSNYASVVANYGSYAPVQTPLAAPTTVPFGVPQTVAGYLPTASYDTQWNPTQVTYYRPVTTFNPQTGTTVTTMQPCTSLQYQAQRVPLAAPAAVLGNNGLQSNLWPGITGPGYYPAGLSNAPAYSGFQQLPASGGAMGTSGVSMGMPPSSLPVRSFNSNNALRPTVLAQPGVPQVAIPQAGVTQSYLPAASYMQPTYAQPLYAPPAYTAPTYSAPVVGSGVVGSGVVGSGALPSMATTITPLSTTTLPPTTLPSSTAFPSAAFPSTPALPSPQVLPSSSGASGVVTAGGYLPPTSSPVGSGVVGSSYYAPAQVLPNNSTPGYAQPYGNIPQANSFQNPVQQSPCANGACPLPSGNRNPYAPVMPSQGNQVLPSTPGNSFGASGTPGVTVTPLGEPRYDPVQPNQLAPTQPSLPPINNLPPGGGLPQGGVGGGLDPEAQRVPTLNPGVTGSYRPATDNFVSVDAERADYTMPAGAVNPNGSAVQNAVTFSPSSGAEASPATSIPASSNSASERSAAPEQNNFQQELAKGARLAPLPGDVGRETSSPTLDLVFGGQQNAPANNGSSLRTPAAIEKTPTDGLASDFAKPIPVPPLLRPSTIDSNALSSKTVDLNVDPNNVESKAFNTNNGNADRVPSGSKVAVPLNSPEGFNPRELGLPNLNDPNDPVAANDPAGNRLPVAQNQKSSANIRFISGDSGAAKVKAGEFVEKQIRWKETVEQKQGNPRLNGQTSNDIQNGVWFEPK